MNFFMDSQLKILTLNCWYWLEILSIWFKSNIDFDFI